MDYQEPWECCWSYNPMTESITQIILKIVSLCLPLTNSCDGFDVIEATV